MPITTREEALEIIQKRLPACFGDADKIFAGHPYDEKRARELRKFAKKNNISLEEVMELVDDFLIKTGFPTDHCAEQVQRAGKFFKSLN